APRCLSSPRPHSWADGGSQRADRRHRQQAHAWTDGCSARRCQDANARPFLAHPRCPEATQGKERLTMPVSARAQFPQARPRRLRRTETLRRMARETRLSVDSLIYPVFVVPGADVKEEISSMPGVYHQSVDRVVEDAREVADLGIPAMLLFGLPGSKDWEGSEAWAHDGVVQQALRAIRRAAPWLVLIADACLCEATSHGHCGIPGPT